MNVKLCAILPNQMLSPDKNLCLSDRVPVLPKPGAAMQYVQTVGEECILNIAIKYREMNQCASYLFADPKSYCSGEEVSLVYFQLSKAFFRQLEPVGKDPVHHRDQLAELVRIMVGVSFLF